MSCATAAGVMGAIDRERFDVVPVGVTPEGHWVVPDVSPEALALTPEHTPTVADDAASVLLPLSTTDSALRVLAPGESAQVLSEVDVVFPLLHGPFGEDGTLQGLFELTDTRYVGAGVFASAAGMDKHYMKLVLAGSGLPIGPFVTITDRAWRADRDAALDSLAHLQAPLFVKPARAGSSIGITRVADPTDREALVAAVEEARRHDPKVVVEQGIVGREIECAVLDGRHGERPRASLCAEIVMGDGGWYDFESKYLGEGEVTLTCPADLPDEVGDRVRETAIRVFEAFGCEGLARVDVFVTEDGEVVVNELNTMPGFTPISQYPRMWAASGLAYPDLINELIALALERPVGLR